MSVYNRTVVLRLGRERREHGRAEQAMGERGTRGDSRKAWSGGDREDRLSTGSRVSRRLRVTFSTWASSFSSPLYETNHQQP